jgi:hypothetical protein
MAVLLYSNGITESYRPKHLVFTEEELLHLFDEFSEIKTSRLTKILNTWCIYGYVSKPEPIEFNKLASDILGEAVYSHILFVHDSELDNNWNVSESILYKSYGEFLEEIHKYIDTVAANVIEQIRMTDEYEDKNIILPQLIAIGATKNKQILFGYNPDEQTKEFYNNEEFYKFSKKVYEYLIRNKPQKEPFTIYADKKAIIVVDTPHVIAFLNSLLEKFKSKEEYEICVDISNMIKEWPQKAKKSRRKKSTSENNLH